MAGPRQVALDAAAAAAIAGQRRLPDRGRRGPTRRQSLAARPTRARRSRPGRRDRRRRPFPGHAEDDARPRGRRPYSASASAKQLASLANATAPADGAETRSSRKGRPLRHVVFEFFTSVAAGRARPVGASKRDAPRHPDAAGSGERASPARAGHVGNQLRGRSRRCGRNPASRSVRDAHPREHRRILAPRARRTTASIFGAAEVDAESQCGIHAALVQRRGSDGARSACHPRPAGRLGDWTGSHGAPSGSPGEGKRCLGDRSRALGDSFAFPWPLDGDTWHTSAVSKANGSAHDGPRHG